MRLLFDGGAFQQGISGGILNVAVNFLNALSRTEPSIDIALLLDDRFGPASAEFIGRLCFQPKLIRIDTRGRDIGIAKLLSDDPAFEVRVDGRPVAVTVEMPVIGFDVDITANTIEVRSRSARPMDVLAGSKDPRRLGFSLTKIRVINAGATSDHFADKPVFDEIGGGVEQDFRWTDGRMQVPASLILAARGGRMEIHTGPRIPYPLFDGRYDEQVSRLAALRSGSQRETFDQHVASIMTENSIDAYFANHFIPITPNGVRLFSWAYDVLPLSNPEFFDDDAVENFQNVKKTFERSDVVFSISDLTKRELIRYTSVNESRVNSTGIGVSPHIHRQPAAAVDEFRRRRELYGPYFVCLATIEPRKNHLRLLQGYKALLDRHVGAPRLVIAGKPGWGFAEVFDTIQTLGLGEKVRHLDNVSDEEVPLLYSGAVACVYPSLREGFGLPVLEAMACGIPVVTSRNSSMEEFAEGAALFVDATSPSSIGMGMATILEDPVRSAELVRKSAAVVERYSWARIAPHIGQIILGAMR